MKLHRLHRHGVLIVGLVGASQWALAQTAAVAEDNGDTSGHLAEIVVTAQRRAERLQDVPMTVTAISGPQLAAAGVENIADLKLVVPGLQFGNGVGFATAHLRGVGSTALGPGIENPIAIYVDGVYYASTSAGFFDFLDVQDVQVLKGPQGTLFGRNATGGLIQVTTREPTQDLQADATLSLGNYDTLKGGFYLSGGVSENVASSLAVQLGHQGKGYGENLVTGKDVFDNDFSGAVRNKWVWTPSEATKLTAALDYSKQKNSMGSIRIVSGEPNLPILNQPPNTGSAWDATNDVEPLFKHKSGGVSVRWDQKLGFANLMNIIAYREGKTDSFFDLDWTAEPYQGAYLYTDENQFSEEIQLSSTAESAIRWVAGFYYFESSSKFDPSNITFDPNPALNPGFTELFLYSTQDARSWAPYGQVTFTVLPRTELTVGARYTDERHEAKGETQLFAGDTQIVAAPAPKTGKTFNKFTYRVALDHRFTDDVKAYASYNTGFKSGGFNTQTPTDPAYKPETLKATEVGVKSELFDRRLRLNVAGFHYAYSDMQVQRVQSAATAIINGAKATIDGVDVDFDWVATERLSFNGSLEYLDAEFDSFPDAPIGPPPGQSGDVTTGSASGNALGYAPDFAATLGASYAFDLPRDSKLRLNVTAAYSDSYSLEPDNILKQDSYTKFNATARFSPADDRYAIVLWGRNLGDEATIEYAATLVNGLRHANYAPPRTYGISFEYHLD